MFVESAPPSQFVYVHPHVHWNEADALMHRIDFSDNDSAAAVGGSHFSLVACSGSRTRVDPKDAIMGLVPALLRSGAR